MSIICCRCNRDIDAIGQDNMSYDIGYALCEDCAGFKPVNEPDYEQDHIQEYEEVSNDENS